MLKLKLIFLVLILVGISCKSNSKLNNSMHRYFNPDEVTIEKETAVLYETKDSVLITNCINGNSELHENLYSLNVDSIVRKNQLIQRDIVKRPVMPNSMIDELGSIELDLMTCVNKEGKSTFARYLKSNKNLNYQLKKEVLFLAMGYEFAKDDQAVCLECGLVKYVINHS